MNTTINRRKKVLLMVTKPGIGGASRYAQDLVDHLSKDEFDASIGVIPTYLQRDISFINDVKTLWFFVKLFKKEKPDIVHLNSPKMGGLGGLAARIANIKKMIYTNHGWSFHEDRSVLQKIIIKIFSWIIVLLSTHTIVLSEKEKNDVKSWLFIKNKISTIPLGIEAPEFLEKTEARKNLFEMAEIPDHGQELILSIGELTKNKGYRYALEALKAYKNKHAYLIIGSGELQKELGSQNANFLGYVQNAAQYMKGCDIFLLPSVKEGLPYVLLEAGFAGIPVIATRVGGIPELAGENENNLVIPKNAPELKNALENKHYIYPPILPLHDMVEQTITVYN